MSTIVSAKRVEPVVARTPLHGKGHAFRRSVVAWLLRHLLPARDNLVGHGQLPRIGIQRILVCRPNHRLGNTVLLTSLMGEIERHFPGAEVDVLGSGEATRSVLGGFATIGELFLLDRRALRRPLATVRTLRRLASKRYDLVVDAASGSSSGRIAAGMAKARYQLRVEGGGGDVPVHFAARPVHALRRALGEARLEPIPALDLRLTVSERERGAATLERVLQGTPANDAPTLAIFPNATGRKRLDATWWQAFVDELVRRAGPLRIVELVAADGQSRIGNAYPTYFTSDPRKLAAFIDAADIYVSADCGVMHLAAATRATTIGIFGATDPDRYAPFGGRNMGFRSDEGCPLAAAIRVAAHLRQSDAM
ncbi:glycosyltransferase family 9 protein [Luteibacter sp. E-22]|uniref:glycosyltransferase family 9 protein n=1 Tax=Luteibacter sp. E-22 TaxID=3404050 RepID=UPI003CF17D11